MTGNVFEPQLFVEADGTLILVWREKGKKGSDLYASHWLDGDELQEAAFTTPERVNDVAGSVSNPGLDEGRAAVALGPHGLVAVAWLTRSNEIRAAIGRDHASSFDPSFRLDRGGRKSYRDFPSLAYDADAVLHAAWIDAREAPRGAEEPADLYYARVQDGTVDEQNLTPAREDSICGCCRPHLDVDPVGAIRIVFRNTANGYRDIFRIAGEATGNFGPLEPVGPPLWKLRGCPRMGPLGIGEAALWNDGSAGSWRTLAATARSREPAVVLAANGSWSPRYPPRLVSSTSNDRDTRLVLVPGVPSGKLLVANGTSWQSFRDDVPGWATSAAVVGDRIHFVGARKGRAPRFQTRSLTPGL